MPRHSVTPSYQPIRAIIAVRVTPVNATQNIAMLVIRIFIDTDRRTQAAKVNEMQTPWIVDTRIFFSVCIQTIALLNCLTYFISSGARLISSCWNYAQASCTGYLSCHLSSNSVVIEARTSA